MACRRYPMSLGHELANWMTDACRNERSSGAIRLGGGRLSSSMGRSSRNDGAGSDPNDGARGGWKRDADEPALEPAAIMKRAWCTSAGSDCVMSAPLGLTRSDPGELRWLPPRPLLIGIGRDVDDIYITRAGNQHSRRRNGTRAAAAKELGGWGRQRAQRGGGRAGGRAPAARGDSTDRCAASGRTLADAAPQWRQISRSGGAVIYGTDLRCAVHVLHNARCNNCVWWTWDMFKTSFFSHFLCATSHILATFNIPAHMATELQRGRPRPAHLGRPLPTPPQLVQVKYELAPFALQARTLRL